MSLADRLAALSQRPPSSCLMHDVMMRLSPDDRAALDAVIKHLRGLRADNQSPRGSSLMLSAAGIARALQAEGHQISVDTAQKHIYENCGCGT